MSQQTSPDENGRYADASARRDRVVLLLARGLTSDQAGADVGVSGSAVRSMLSDHPEMRQQIASVRDELFRAAVSSAVDRVRDAFRVLGEIMDDDTAPANVRVQAARALISESLKGRSEIDVADRVAALESDKQTNTVTFAEAVTRLEALRDADAG
jgi:hypothetical protein